MFQFKWHTEKKQTLKLNLIKLTEAAKVYSVYRKQFFALKSFIVLVNLIEFTANKIEHKQSHSVSSLCRFFLLFKSNYHFKKKVRSNVSI